MKLLNISYDNVTVPEALQAAEALTEKPEKSAVFFLNLDSLCKAYADKEFAEILCGASLVLPDGVGLKIVTRMFGGKMKANCNGTDFSPLFMQALAKRGNKIFFLGGKEGVADRAAEIISQKIPGIRIVGTHSGYFHSDEQVIEKINASGADVLFVALGAPYQEKWIWKNRARLRVRICLGVGALFDWISGRLCRAPGFLRRLHLEWLWRIILEPKRMAKRYLVDGIGFLAFLVFYRLRFRRS